MLTLCVNWYQPEQSEIVEVYPIVPPGNVASLGMIPGEPKHSATSNSYRMNA